MELYSIITILICLTAFFAFINAKFIKLPNTIGMMMLAVGVSCIVQWGYDLFPLSIQTKIILIAQLDFSKIVLDILLSFLLFAGALHTDFKLMKEHKLGISIFSLFSVLLSAFMLAFILQLLASFVSIQIPFVYCLLLGAIVSPTDPIAVLGILTKAGVPKKIEINIVGESLFNDGVAVVLFMTILQIILQNNQTINFSAAVLLFIQEAFGGILLGILLGYFLFLAVKHINDYESEIILTIAAVMGGTILANACHVSAPLAMVACGLMTGHKTIQEAMSDHTAIYVEKFWHLVDILLNAILFVLMGLKLMNIPFDKTSITIAVFCIPFALIIRYLSLWLPFLLVKKHLDISLQDLKIMTWGGLRGGLSIAMALSIPQDIEYKSLFVTITYALVFFSIFMQGLTIEKVAKQFMNNR